MNHLNTSRPRRRKDHLQFHTFNCEQSVALSHVGSDLRVERHHSSGHLGSYFAMGRTRYRLTCLDARASEMPVPACEPQIDIVASDPAAALHDPSINSDLRPTRLDRLKFAQAYAFAVYRKSLVGTPLNDVELSPLTVHVVK